SRSCRTNRSPRSSISPKAPSRGASTKRAACSSSGSPRRSRPPGPPPSKTALSFPAMPSDSDLDPDLDGLPDAALDDRVRQAMGALDRALPAGTFASLAERTLARLEDPDIHAL